MPKYKYTATDAAGAQVTGVIDGATPTAAGVALMERDLNVSAISEHRIEPALDDLVDQLQAIEMEAEAVRDSRPALSGGPSRRIHAATP